MNKKCAILTTVDVSMSWFMIPYVKELKSRGVDVTLICNMTDDFLEKYSKDYNCVSLDLERGFNLAKTIKGYKNLLKLFKKESFDFIEYATENVSLPASIAGACAKVPVRVYDEWGVLFVGFSGIKRVVAWTIEKIISVFSTDIRQASEKNKDLCVRSHLYRPNKSKVLGKGGTIGVDISIYDISKKNQYRSEIFEKYNIPVKAMLFGFVGRIQSDKGINELIEAFKKVLEKNSNLYLMLVGFVDKANPIKPENMEWAQNSPNVVFTGRVDGAQKYTSAFDVLVHPTYREGFSMVLQEAAAVKTPIITTNIIGPAEFITNGFNGVIVEPHDSDDLYNGLMFAIENPEKMSLFAENGYKYTIENFERTIMVNRMVEDRMQILQNASVLRKSED